MAPDVINHRHYPIQLYYFSSKTDCNFGSHTSCIRGVYSFCCLSCDRSTTSSVVCLATGPQPLLLSVLRQVHNLFCCLSCDRPTTSSVVCLATGPQPLLKRVLHTVQSSVFAFNSEYYLFSLSSYSSSLGLLRHPPVTSIFLFLCTAYVYTHTHIYIYIYIYIYILIATSKIVSIVS